MNVTLKPYTGYKDSGLPWLGDVPKHWDVQRGKYIFRSIDVRSKSGEEELLTVSSERGVIPRRSANVTMFEAESYVGHKLCGPNDLVINSLWAWAGGLGVSQYHGIVSAAYGVYRLHENSTVDSRFIHRLVRSAPFHWELRVRSKGVWTSRLQLTDDSFFGAPLPIPPLPEQATIVRFLGHFDRCVNRLIRAKRRHIVLLNEQKQDIIHQAVTRGLDPNVRLKPSGIEWLGEVPEHWELKRFKFMARIGSGQVDPRRPPYSEYILIAPNHIESGTGRIIAEVTAADQGADSGKYLVEKGQVIYSKIRPNLKKCAIATAKCLCSADMYAISPSNQNLRSEFLVNLLLSVPFTRYVVDCSLRVAMPKVNREALGDGWLWFPSIAEQDAILSNLYSETAPIDESIKNTRSEIDLLREYRTRLIADVVTGKLDVRGVELPELEDDGEMEHLDVEGEAELDDLDEPLEDPDDDE